MKDFRSDHMGSLLRPASLLEKRRRHANGGLPLTELRKAEDAAILEIVRKQEAIGLPVVTDGEFRRSSFLSGCFEALEGLVEPEHAFKIQCTAPENSPPTLSQPSLPFVAAKRLQPKRRMTNVETKFLKDHCPRRYKVTMAGPTLGLSERVALAQALSL